MLIAAGLAARPAVPVASAAAAAAAPRTSAGTPSGLLSRTTPARHGAAAVRLRPALSEDVCAY